MTSHAVSLDRELQAFAVELFERSGGAADWPSPDDPGTVVVPPALAAAAELPGEEFTLGAAPRSAAVHVSLVGDFLDMAARTLQAAVPREGAFAVADRRLTNRDLTDKIEKTFTWQNARAKCREAEADFANYHLWTLHGALRSEDVWEGVFNFGVNAESRAIIELPDVFREPGLTGAEPAGDAGEPSTYAAAVAEGKRRLITAAA